MDDPNITMEEYIKLEEEKTCRRGKVYNWETATYGKIWDNEDVHDLRSVETKFTAIVFNDTLTFEAALSCEPTVSSLNNGEIDFRISFDESNDEDCTNTPYPHQRYVVYNTLVNNEEGTSFTSIRRIHQEDKAYLCLQFTRYHEGFKSNTPYPGTSIRRIQDLLYTKILEDIKHGPYSKKSPIR
ncbi:hypothetical protein Tco_1329212, partial [Tanacetum coccineum]